MNHEVINPSVRRTVHTVGLGQPCCKNDFVDLRAPSIDSVSFCNNTCLDFLKNRHKVSSCPYVSVWLGNGLTTYMSFS